MAIPTDNHLQLTNWLDAQVPDCAGEIADHVILRSFDPIESLIEPQHLSPAVLELFRNAKESLARHPDRWGSFDASAAATLSPVEPICEALEAICIDLARYGIRATPYEGIGIASGTEPWECSIVVENPTRLAEVLGVG